MIATVKLQIISKGNVTSQTLAGNRAFLYFLNSLVFFTWKKSSENTDFRDTRTSPELQGQANYTDVANLFLLYRVWAIFLYVHYVQFSSINNCQCCRLHPLYLRCALSDQVSLATPAGPCPARTRRVVYTFSYIAAVCRLLARASPLLHTRWRGRFFYCFSPGSCKAGGRGLLWISHAPCRKVPRGRHNGLLWGPPPSLNSPAPPCTPLLCLHHLISSPSSPSELELIVLYNTPIHWWL